LFLRYCPSFLSQQGWRPLKPWRGGLREQQRVGTIAAFSDFAEVGRPGSDKTI